MSFYDLQQMFALVVPVVGPLAGVIYTWWATQKAAARKEIEALTKRLDSAERQLAAAGTNANALAAIAEDLAVHDKRLTGVENDLKHMPTAADVNELKLSLVKLEGVIGRVEEQMSSVSRTTHRIDDYLREGARS
jgi:predicted  nucleic acid-binding Zn-ribbon protein